MIGNAPPGDSPHTIDGPLLVQAVADGLGDLRASAYRALRDDWFTPLTLTADTVARLRDAAADWVEQLPDDARQVFDTLVADDSSADATLASFADAAAAVTAGT